jgi:WhiB family redox-sensing transcriptional regulator
MIAMTMEMEKGSLGFDQPQSPIVFEGGLPVLRDAVLIEEVEVIKAEQKKIQLLQAFQDELLLKIKDPSTNIERFFASIFDQYAECSDKDRDIFFPEKSGSTKEAKAICATCDIKPVCLEYAIIKNEKFGIWGGTGEGERRKIRKQRKLAKKLVEEQEKNEAMNA